MEKPPSGAADPIAAFLAETAHIGDTTTRSDDTIMPDLPPIIRPALKRPKPYLPQPGHIVLDNSLPTRRMSEGEHMAVQTRLVPTTANQTVRHWLVRFGILLVIAGGIAFAINEIFSPN